MSSSEVFPLFPLSIFPVPGQQTGLHIFEARYRLLFEQLESMELVEFGIPFSLNGKLSGYGRELSHIGIKEFVNVKAINVYEE